MTELREPERWLTAEDEIATKLRPALQMSRGEGPSASEHERMWGSIAGKLPFAAFGGATVSPAAANEAVAARLPGSPPWIWIAGTGVVAAVIGFSVATMLFRPQVAPSRGVAPAVTSATQPTAFEPARLPAETTTPSVDESTPKSAAPAPSLRSRAVARRKSVSVDEHLTASELPGVDPNASTTDLAAELDLLARARRVVATQPERALQLTAEHGRLFQTGALAQEREVLAIDALQRLGLRELAEARARRFAERYPDSAHRVRIAAELNTQ
jgi:hypothetical protein